MFLIGIKRLSSFFFKFVNMMKNNSSTV